MLLPSVLCLRTRTRCHPREGGAREAKGPHGEKAQGHCELVPSQHCLFLSPIVRDGQCADFQFNGFSIGFLTFFEISIGFGLDF